MWWMKVLIVVGLGIQSQCQGTFGARNRGNQLLELCLCQAKHTDVSLAIQRTTGTYVPSVRVCFFFVGRHMLVFTCMAVSRLRALRAIGRRGEVTSHTH